MGEVTILAQRARACWENGRIGRSLDGLIEARSILAQARENSDEMAQADANRCIGWFCLQVGYVDEGLEAAQAARNFYAGRDDDWGHALSLSVYSWLLNEAGLADLSFESAAEAAVIAARTEDAALNAFAMNCKAVALVLCHEYKLALDLLDEAMQLAMRSRDLSTIALTNINSGYAKFFLRQQVKREDPAGAEAIGWEFAEDFMRGADAARSIGDEWNLRVALCNAAEAYVLVGELVLAQTCIDEVERLVHNPGPRGQIHHLYSKSDIHRALGEYDKSLALLLQADAVLSSVSNQSHKTNILRRLADIKAVIGHFEEAYRYHCAFHEAYVTEGGELSRRRAHAIDRKLENDKLREQAAVLEAQAGLDALTGVPNRRAFDGLFEGLAHKKAVIGILDVDHFKQVNDLYSHPVGDAVLRRVAAILHGCDPAMRVFRIGGEEFALIFEGLGLEHAERIVGHAMEALRAMDFSDIAPGLRVTVSVGLSEAGLLTGSALLAEADRRLYVAKKLGRDRLISDSRSSMAVPAE
jgi:diguanylate cyclase (GGDEF)-like protein